MWTFSTTSCKCTTSCKSLLTKRLCPHTKSNFQSVSLNRRIYVNGYYMHLNVVFKDIHVARKIIDIKSPKCYQRWSLNGGISRLFYFIYLLIK